MKHSKTRYYLKGKEVFPEIIDIQGHSFSHVYYDEADTLPPGFFLKSIGMTSEEFDAMPKLIGRSANYIITDGKD